MKDKIRSVLDEFYNVNMFNDSVRDRIATEIEIALTGKTSVSPLSKPSEVKMTPIKKPFEDKKKKSLSKNVKSPKTPTNMGLKNINKNGGGNGRSKSRAKKRA